MEIKQGYSYHIKDEFKEEYLWSVLKRFISKARLI